MKDRITNTDWIKQELYNVAPAPDPRAAVYVPTPAEPRRRGLSHWPMKEKAT